MTRRRSPSTSARDSLVADPPARAAAAEAVDGRRLRRPPLCLLGGRYGRLSFQEAPPHGVPPLAPASLAGVRSAALATIRLATRPAVRLWSVGLDLPRTKAWAKAWAKVQ